MVTPKKGKPPSGKADQLRALREERYAATQREAFARAKEAAKKDEGR